MIRTTYSPQADALGIRLAPGIGHVVTQERRQSIHADFDETRRLVGIEVLDASMFYDQAELDQLPRPTGNLSRGARQERVRRAGKGAP